MSRQATDGPSVAWFHCFSGIAGDMALGSLLDAGADLAEVLAILERIPLPGWSLETREVLRGGIACTRAVVTARDDVVIRTHAHIVGLLSEARLPERVLQRALAVFARLADVEGRLHHRSPDQVHFHEVGGHDAIVDIVGTAAALEVLGVDRVAASAVATGTGTVRTAHGLVPNPSPAVVRLLREAPTYGRETTVELTTPTGAAILAALAEGFGPMPAMRIGPSGFGAGRHDLDDLPNCTQVIVGQSLVATGGGDGQPVLVLEANLDDVTGEQLAHAVEALLEAGAHDVWISPVVMKKGRPGHVLHVLADPSRKQALRDLMQSSTGTLGVRATAGQRWPNARRMAQVDVGGEPVRMKVAATRVKAEFEDVARVAARTGLPLHEVSSLAEEAWRRRDPPGPDPAAGPGARVAPHGRAGEGDPDNDDPGEPA